MPDFAPTIPLTKKRPAPHLPLSYYRGLYRISQRVGERNATGTSVFLLTRVEPSATYPPVRSRARGSACRVPLPVRSLGDRISLQICSAITYPLSQ